LSAIAKPQLFGVRPSKPAPKHTTDFVRPLAGGSSPRALKRLQEFCKNFLKGGLETAANFARGLLRRSSRMNFGGGVAIPLADFFRSTRRLLARHLGAAPAIMRGWIAWTPYDF
jgi:hypothetical protein